jgi:hypothetical protein
MARPRHAASSGAAHSPDSYRRGGRRWGLVVAGLLLIAVALVAAWVGYRSYTAARALRAAKADLAAVPAQLTHGDVAGAKASLAAAQQESSAAASAAADPLVHLAAHLPVVGATPRALIAVAQTADDLTHGPFEELIAAGQAMAPDQLRTSGDTVNLAAFQQAAPHLSAALGGLKAAQARMAALDDAGAPGVVQRSVAGFDDQLGSLTTATQNAFTAAQLAPAMLGADGPRHYFVALQSNNELRGTGGLMGQWAIITADHGAVRLQRFASDAELAAQRYSPTPSERSGGYRALYGGGRVTWASANLSPHFPDAARLWLAMWAARTGQHLDGVIAADPVALSYVLDATGPARLSDGTRLTGNQVVPFVESRVYSRFAGNDVGRKAVLVDVATASFRQLISGRGDPHQLLTALGRAAGERRLLVYSAHPAQQQLIDGTDVSGSLPSGPGPVAGIGVVNAGGNKLDYYLRAAMAYQVAGCRPDGSRLTGVTVTVDNTVPHHGRGLPPEVVQRLDLAGGGSTSGASTRGQSFDYLQIYVAPGTVVQSVEQDGRRVVPFTGVERGLPVLRLPLRVDAGGRSVVRVTMTEPPSAVPVRTFATPLVKSVAVTADGTQCPVPAG